MNSPQLLGKRAVNSIITLISRTLFLNLVNFAGAFALTIFLSPGDFGIFIITSTIIDILTYFSDIGLAGALIQKKEEPKSEEINATFTIQMTLVSISILIALIFSKNIIAIYSLNTISLWLLYSLLLSFFFSSLKTIPSVIAERSLQFSKVVLPQIVETIIFNVIVVVLAWKGYGVISYVVAVLARAISGTIVIYLLVPYRPRLFFSIASIKGLLKFGIPFQLNSFIAVLKDKVSLLILGKIIGIEALGILGWAEKWANLPLRYFLDASTKVSFSLFSRLQDEKDKLRTALENSLYFISVLVFPMLAGSSIAMPLLVLIIPKYSKWNSGLPVFQLFLISAAVAAISTFLSNTLTALGKVKSVLGLMIMWTILTLTFYPILAIKFGITGIGLASILVSCSSIVPYFLVKRHINFSLLPQIVPALLASLIMTAILHYIQFFLPQNFVGLGAIIIIGMISYATVLLLIDRKRVFERGKIFINLARK